MTKGRPGRTTWLGGISPAGKTVVRVGAALTMLVGVVGARAGSAVATGASPRSADMGVTLIASPDHVSSGAKVQFKAIVTNNGPDAATTAVLTEQLSAGSFVNSSLLGDCSLVTAQQMTCDIGNIGSGGSATRDVLVTAPSSNFSDTASVTADQADRNPSNDSATFNETICVDCTGGFVTNGGTLNGPPINRGTVKQSATLFVPTSITGPVTSDNVVLPDCPEFEQYGQVFLVVGDPATPTSPYEFSLTIESNNDPTLGVPIQEPVGQIEVLRGCTPLKQCIRNLDGSFSIPVAKPGKPAIHGCVLQVQRNNKSGDVNIKTLDDGALGDPPIRGGG